MIIAGDGFTHNFRTLIRCWVRFRLLERNQPDVVDVNVLSTWTSGDFGVLQPHVDVADDSQSSTCRTYDDPARRTMSRHSRYAQCIVVKYTGKRLLLSCASSPLLGLFR